MQRIEHIPTALLFLMVSLTVACSEGSTGVEDELTDGTYEATVTGDVEATISGSAKFGSELSSTGTGILALWLGGASSPFIRFQREVEGGIARPATGEYPITYAGETGTEGNTDFTVFAHPGGESPVLWSISGSVTISSSSVDLVVGSFQFEAADYQQPETIGDMRFTITGTFRAVCDPPLSSSTTCQ